jgi:hypothetical protein
MKSNLGRVYKLGAVLDGYGPNFIKISAEVMQVKYVD